MKTSQSFDNDAILDSFSVGVPDYTWSWKMVKLKMHVVNRLSVLIVVSFNILRIRSFIKNNYTSIHSIWRYFIGCKLRRFIFSNKLMFQALHRSCWTNVAVDLSMYNNSEDLRIRYIRIDFIYFESSQIHLHL